jgi:hypothetical protein
MIKPGVPSRRTGAPRPASCAIKTRRYPFVLEIDYDANDRRAGRLSECLPIYTLIVILGVPIAIIIIVVKLSKRK